MGSDSDSEILIAADDPRAPDVQALLEKHLAFAHEVTPADHVHALDVERLVDPAVTFFSARRRTDNVLLGVAALKRVDDGHAEIKSMHVGEAARGTGVGRALVEHLLATAADAGFRRVSLETGTMPAFAAARTLYQRIGFTPCPPFAEYSDTPFSTCMTIVVRP